MALPENVNTVLVTGRYIDLGGTPLSGTITFTPTVTIVRNPAAAVLITDKAFSVALDSTGAFSINLPATNDPDVVPSGWAYTVLEQLTDHRRQWTLEVPYDAVAINVALVGDAVAATPTVTYVTAADLAAVRGSPGGIATLDGDGRIPDAQLPDWLQLARAIRVTRF